MRMLRTVDGKLWREVPMETWDKTSDWYREILMVNLEVVFVVRHMEV